MAKKKITVVETCPRDGWEHQPFVIPTETKLKYIKKMIDCGAKILDLVNFADPEKVPTMANSPVVLRETMQYVEENHLDVECMALSFSPEGMEQALDAGARSLQFAFSASDRTCEFLGTTLEKSMENMKAVIKAANGTRIKIGLLCSFGSPFGDEVTVDRLKHIADAAFNAGAYSLSLPDTAGLASPHHVRRVVREMVREFGAGRLSVHLHNAYGMGLANAMAAADEGITSLEGALGGLGEGPFPFIPSNNNLATEDIVNMLEASGYDTGFNLKKLVETANELCEETGAVHTSALYDKKDCLLCRDQDRGEVQP